jgi:hypothetical protein
MIGATISFCTGYISMLVASVWSMPLAILICWAHEMRRISHNTVRLNRGGSNNFGVQEIIWSAVVAASHHIDWNGG